MSNDSIKKFATLIKPDVENIKINNMWSDKLQNFSDFASKFNNILIIVNDTERTTPTGLILDKLKQYAPKLHNKSSILIATGTHIISNDEKIKNIIGSFKPKNIYIHDCRNKSRLIYIGKTSFNNRIFINNILNKFQAVVTINSIEPHYFAGFTGGRKSFLPGIASFDSIEKNHSFALDDRSGPMKLNGNPVHEDMNEVIDMIHKPVYSIQIIYYEGIVFDIFTDNIRKSFNEGVEYSKKLFSVKISEKADLVIVNVNKPFSNTLYQAQKALIHASLSVKQNGKIIFISSCSNGVGDISYFKLLSSFSKPEDVIDFVKDNYKFGYHKSHYMAKIANDNTIYALTDLNESICKKCFMKKINKISDVIDENYLKNNKVYFMPAGEVTIPYQ